MLRYAAPAATLIALGIFPRCSFSCSTRQSIYLVLPPLSSSNGINRIQHSNLTLRLSVFRLASISSFSGVCAFSFSRLPLRVYSDSARQLASSLALVKGSYAGFFEVAELAHIDLSLSIPQAAHSHLVQRILCAQSLDHLGRWFALPCRCISPWQHVGYTEYFAIGRCHRSCNPRVVILCRHGTAKPMAVTYCTTICVL